MIERIRGRKLQAIRHAHLSAYPLCVACTSKDRATPATQVDHIIALVNGGTETAENRQSLCDDCHRDKTATDMGWKQRPVIGADGWPVEGA